MQSCKSCCKCQPMFFISLSRCIAYGPSFARLYYIIAMVMCTMRTKSSATHPVIRGPVAAPVVHKKHALLITFCLNIRHCILYQVIQIHQLLPLRWQLHVYYHLTSYVCPKEFACIMLFSGHCTIFIVLTRSLETAVVISAYGPLMNDPHKAVKTKN